MLKNEILLIIQHVNTWEISRVGQVVKSHKGHTQNQEYLHTQLVLPALCITYLFFNKLQCTQFSTMAINTGVDLLKEYSIPVCKVNFQFARGFQLTECGKKSLYVEYPVI